MKQYCRYCIYLCVNNFPYCSKREKALKESYCKRPNNCKDFMFADCEPEFQDAFGETNGYKPRSPRNPKAKECDGQMNLFEADEYVKSNSYGTKTSARLHKQKS